MINIREIDNLSECYEVAKRAVSCIKPLENGYFEYPQEITEFMKLLSGEPWINYDYNPAEVKEILNDIEQASFKQVCAALTGVVRSERFFNGAWEKHLKSGRIDALITRIRELS